MRILGMDIGEIIFIAIIALILFGPNKLPEFAKSLGKSIREFKKSLKEGLEEEKVEETKSVK
jgi:sec-independent protein translocase protein TatA